MATLTGSTIESTYDRLLSLDSGGLNGASLVNMTDGNASATACISITDNATGKAILSIDGSHANGTALQIDNSAGDGDVSVEWQLSGTTTWLMGIEDGDSDSLKICHDSTMGTDERLSFLTASTVINEDSADIDFRVEGNGNANLLFCDAGNDRGGIGTAAPDGAFDIEGEDGHIVSYVTCYSATDGHQPILSIRKSDGSTPGTPAATADGDSLGYIHFSGVNSGGAFDTAATIFVAQDGASASDISGKLGFQTVNAGTAATHMMIRADGNVGIGTTAPVKGLHVIDSLVIKGKAAFQLTGTVDPGNGTTTLPGGSTKFTEELNIGDQIDITSDIRMITAIGSDTSLTMNLTYPDDLGSDSTPQSKPSPLTVLKTDGTIGMVLNASGYLGIGTAAPGAMCEVSGNIISQSATGTAAGGGIDIIAPTISVGNYNSEIVTTIFIDIGAGSILSSGSAGDVIGEDGVANAYVTRITTAINGLVYRGEIICLEVPTTGDPDVNICANASGTIAEDAAGEGEHVLANCGVHTLGLKTDMTIPAGGIVDDYIYLTHGDNTAGTYNAGKFLIRFYGASITSL